MPATPAKHMPDQCLDNSLAGRKLQVVATCRLRDLSVLKIVAEQLPKTVPFRQLCVIAPDRECRQMRSKLAGDINVMPEDEFIPGMTKDELCRLKLREFPKGAGWYFQQLLKLQFAFVEPEDDYYLIWDADTIPLRQMRFFDSDGRMLLTKATEYHEPYFDTYRRLLHEEPRREFSLIAQHMIVKKSRMREMLACIERRQGGEDNWAWKIMRSLPDNGNNLFSEYETYGHYVKNHHADQIRCIDRNWRRERTSAAGCALPSREELTELSETYDYVAFERASPAWRRMARGLLGALQSFRFRSSS